MSVVVYLRDITLCHVCSSHFGAGGCRLRPWDCKSVCGTDISRNPQHRASDAKAPECVVCVYMQYELERLKP